MQFLISAARALMQSDGKSTMTPQEIKEARKHLGLTQSRMGALLDTTDRVVRAMESDPASSQHRLPAPRMVRLIQAYLSGYRPIDWPVGRDGWRDDE